MKNVVRAWLLAAVALLVSVPSWAQVGCVPNPNASAPPFIDGCPVPASALNRIMVSGLPNFSATPIFNGSVSGAVTVYTLGSVATPDNTTNSTSIVQKYGTGLASGSQTNGALYVSNTMTGTAAGDRATAIIAEGVDVNGGFGTFVEGGRFHATVQVGSVGGQADGVVCLGQNTGGAAWAFLVGCEADIENSTSDAPVSTSFNQNHFAVDFLATNAQGASSHIIDAGFMVNPFNAKASRVGFFVPPGTQVSDSDFRGASTAVYGLDLSGGTFSGAAIDLPNNTAVTAHGVGGTDVNLFYLASGSNAFVLGTGTQGITLPAVSAPGTPGAGFFFIYMDGADNKLKAKGPGGAAVVLAGATSGVSCAAGTVSLTTLVVTDGIVTHC